MNRTKLTSLAHVIRSKNAGPTQLTIDIFFRDAAAYKQAVASTALSTTAVAKMYLLGAGQVKRFDLPSILALKFSMPRLCVAGSPGDGDVYGAQQHAPFLEVLL
jgi:hypothetical protein